MNNEHSDRRSQDAQLGYLTGKIEAIEERLDQHMDAEEKQQELLDRKFEMIMEQLSMYRHLSFFIRTLAVIFAAILAGNWESVKMAWISFVHGGH
jgi:hypothetical protein